MFYTVLHVFIRFYTFCMYSYVFVHFYTFYTFLYVFLRFYAFFLRFYTFYTFLCVLQFFMCFLYISYVFTHFYSFYLFLSVCIGNWKIMHVSLITTNLLSPILMARRSSSLRTMTHVVEAPFAMVTEWALAKTLVRSMA